MEAKELRERSEQDLAELQSQLKRDLFGNRMKNFTGQLSDTSLLRKARRDLARIRLILAERAAKAKAEAGSQS